jgi:hypothetical protein
MLSRWRHHSSVSLHTSAWEDSEGRQGTQTHGVQGTRHREPARGGRGRGGRSSPSKTPTQVLLKGLHSVRQHIQVLIPAAHLPLCILQLLLQAGDLTKHHTRGNGPLHNTRDVRTLQWSRGGTRAVHRATTPCTVPAGGSRRGTLAGSGWLHVSPRCWCGPVGRPPCPRWPPEGHKSRGGAHTVRGEHVIGAHAHTNMPAQDLDWATAHRTAKSCRRSGARASTRAGIPRTALARCRRWDRLRRARDASASTPANCNKPRKEGGMEMLTGLTGRLKYKQRVPKDALASPSPVPMHSPDQPAAG